MQEILVRKLHDYIRENNPDLLFTLQQESKVTAYLQDNVSTVDELIHSLLGNNQPVSLIEELCMKELTKPLRPSRFNYLKVLLEQEFQKDYERFYENGILTMELINIISACDPVFDELEFSEEKEDDRNLRYAMIGAVHEYLKVNSEK